MKGRIVIARWTSIDKSGIRVEFTDVDSRTRFAVIDLTHEDFSKVPVTGMEVEGELEVRGLDVVGMLAENKSEEILVKFSYGDKGKLQELVAAQEFEVDGWKARMSDLTNSYNRTSKGIKVAYFRHVPKVAE